MIDDETAPETQLYISVLNEDQGLLTNIHGPELAMFRMEEKLRLQGKTPAPLQPIVDKELARRQRVSGTGLPSGQGRNKSTTYVLTKDQQLLAERSGIPLDQYAKVARSLESGAEVEAS